MLYGHQLLTQTYFLTLVQDDFYFVRIAVETNYRNPYHCLSLNDSMNKARGINNGHNYNSLVAAGLAFLIVATASIIGMERQVAAQQQDDEIYRIQETAMSRQRLWLIPETFLMQ